MAADPLEGDLVNLQQLQQLLPEIRVEGLFPGIAHPALLFPFGGPALLDGVHYIFGVGNQKHPAGAFEGGKPLDDGSELHAVVGGAGLPAGELLFPCAADQNRAPSAGAGIAAARSVGVDGDLGEGSFLCFLHS